jgi:predicted regulator of Ras-like GTPase activity (Roadblock/LC7/MglB family)
MDPKEALADLTEISSQIQAAVIVDGEGSVLASTLDDARARQMAEAARELLRAAEEQGTSGAQLGQLQAATLEESVFVVRDGERIIAATTGPEPTVGLVFYDLKNCLRTVTAETSEEAKPKPRAKRKAQEGSAAS